MKGVTLKELSNNLWEGLEGEVLSISYPHKYNAIIHFNCLDWVKNGQTRKFNIVCNNVADIKLSSSRSDEICFLEDHVLLWKYNLPQFDLYYSSKPHNVYELLGRLWENHEKLLRSFACEYESIDPVNFIKQSSDGYGFLARGPEPLIDSYVSCIDCLIETKKVFSYIPRAHHVGLLFDCGHVIAQSIEIEEC